MLTKPITKSQILDWLEAVKDPEIPVLSIVDLGVVREVEPEGDTWVVTITPTYSGCPAMKTIETDIATNLRSHGLNVRVDTTIEATWTTDWISPKGKQALREYGIAPPEHTSADKGVLFGRTKEVDCPHCGSSHTQMTSQFGSTACKALYRCLDCQEPFDYFKCI